MRTFKYDQQQSHVVRTIVAECNIIWRDNKMKKEDVCRSSEWVWQWKDERATDALQKKFNRIREMCEYRRHKDRFKM